jgi:hypothetical protein
MYTLQVRVVKLGEDGKVKGAVREYVDKQVTSDQELAVRSMDALAVMVEGVLPEWGFALPVKEEDPTVGIRKGWME